MDNKEKRSYFFNITEVKDNKTYEVMNFNFGGHHDLNDVYVQYKALGLTNDKHTKELALGVRLLHHVMKKYPNNEILAKYYTQFEDFKKALEEATAKVPCGC